MTFIETIEFIESLRPAGMQMGLERMETAVKQLHDPHTAFDCIHIAGTNGKGSTASMIAQALTANGYHTGLFTSPAVTSIRDTILIDGVPISKTAFAACAERIIRAGVTGVSEFEFLTLLMLCYFESSAVDIAVIECGLGGEMDATNIIPPPLSAVFTPIAIDHTAILGKTITEIAAQKSGIAKAPCNIICAPDMNGEALGVIFEKAATAGQTVYLPSPSSLSDIRFNNGKAQFYYRDIPVMLSLCGQHQPQNALTALTVLECLQKHGHRIDLRKAAKALAAVKMPCRLELIDGVPPVLLDGAHNPHGIKALCDTVTMLFNKPVTLVIGMLTEKDIEACLQMLAPLCERIICCTPQETPRALPATELARIAASYHHAVQAVAHPINAFEAAKKAADQTPIVVGGSFYTASVVRHAVIS